MRRAFWWGVQKGKNCWSMMWWMDCDVCFDEYGNSKSVCVNECRKMMMRRRRRNEKKEEEEQ